MSMIMRGDIANVLASSLNLFPLSQCRREMRLLSLVNVRPELRYAKVCTTDSGSFIGLSLRYPRRDLAGVRPVSARLTNLKLRPPVLIGSLLPAML